MAKKGSLVSAIFWMIFISLLLFWLPVAGPLLAGFVGGHKAGSLGSAILATLLPAVVMGIGLFALATALTGFPLIGAIAAAGGLVLALSHVGLLLVGAIVGGLLA